MRLKLDKRSLFRIVGLICLLDCLFYCWNFVPIDWYFLVPTGEYIMHNGLPLPDTNPWFVFDEPQVPGHPYVIQQWLYCIYAYLVDKMHLRLLSILLIAALIYLVFRELTSDRLDWKDSLMMCICVLWTAKHFMFSLRPEALTVCLLMLEILGLEMFKRCAADEKPLWKPYAIVLLSSVLEANFHSSMWVFHVCVLIAYAAPCPGLKGSLRSVRHFFGLLAVVLLGSVCSPIGTQPIVYIFDALHSNTFELVEVIEMSRGDAGIIPVLTLFAVPLVYGLIKRKITSPTLFMTVGFAAMYVLAVRNRMFLPVAGMMLVHDICDKDFMESRITTRQFVGVPLVLLGLVLLLNIRDFPYICSDGQRHEYPVSDSDPAIAEILKRENGDRSVHIYTGSESGAYLEYHGFTRLYVDARPEMFNRPGILEDMTVLEEQCYYFNTGVKADGSKVTDEEISERLERYDFKYFCLSTDFAQRLCEYLQNSDDYEELVHNGCIYLYVRK